MRDYFSGAVERMRLQTTALGFAWLTSAIIDIAVWLGLGAGSGQIIPDGYLALYVILGLSGSVLLGFVFGLIALPFEVTIALWVVLNMSGIGFSAGNLLFGTGVGLVLILSKSVLPAPWRTGARVGVVVGVMLALWPASVRQLPLMTQISPWLESSLPFLLAATVFAILCIVGGGRRNRMRATTEMAVIAIVVVVSYGVGYRADHISLDVPPTVLNRVDASDEPDILLIVLDTLRTDRMSLYGYERSTTPQLDAFVARHENAVVYPLAFTNASWTVPAHASLFTGLLPTDHGAHQQGDRTFDGGFSRHFGMAPVPSLAQRLRSAGYRTAGSVANGILKTVDGIDRGFDWWIYPAQLRTLKLLGERVRRQFFANSLDWAFGRWFTSAEAISATVLSIFDGCAGRPCFVFANFMDTHAPYIPPPPHAGLFARSSDRHVGKHNPLISDDAATLAYLSDRYDETLHALDARLGALLEELESRDVLENTWLIITSDHGESWGEHGVVDHGTSLYNEQVSIPLIIKPPDEIRIPQIDEPVSLVDVTATITDIATGQILGVGASLLDASIPRPPVQMQYFAAEDQFRIDDYGAINQLMRAMAGNGLKLIDREMGQEIYDLALDFGEQKNLFVNTPATDREHLMDLLPEMPKRLLIRKRREDRLSQEDRAALKALGYVD
jgi:arylsulfatase A-like enzyme